MEDLLKGLYVRLPEGIIYVDCFDRVTELYEDNYVKADALKVGYHDYSIEMIFDGSFLYLVDRDDETDRNIDFKSMQELLDIMQEHGNMYVDFLKAIPVYIPISNAMNHDDFYVGDLREKILEDIISGVTGKYLTLYPEDYANTNGWEKICEKLKIDSKISSVDVYYVKSVVKEEK